MGIQNPNPKLCVDGHEFADRESNLTGDGKFAPFRIFDTDAQDYLPGEYPTRAAAENALAAYSCEVRP